MKTSTKVLAGLTLLLSASSVSLVQAAPASVSDPVLFGGASLGYNGAVSGSALQGSRHYPYGPDPLKGAFIYPDYHVTSVSDPLIFGGASLGYNGAVSGSALQGSRHYPHGPDPLKGRYVWADVDWVIVVHPTHHHHHHHM